MSNSQSPPFSERVVFTVVEWGGGGDISVRNFNSAAMRQMAENFGSRPMYLCVIKTLYNRTYSCDRLNKMGCFQHTDFQNFLLLCIL